MKRIRSGRDGFSAMVLLAGMLSCFPGRDGAAEKLPDASEVTRRIIERAQAVARAEQSPPHLYEKHSLFEELDARGQTIKSEERVYQVMLIAGFPFNRLVKIQGRDLTADELKKEQQREEKFQKKFVSADAKQMAARKEGWVTAPLLDRYQFTVQERIILSNRATLVLTFRPKTGPLPAKTMQDKLLNRMAGTVWIDEADADTARLVVNLVEPVSLGWFGILGSLSQCDLSLERQRQPDGVWLNTRQVLLLQYRKLTATRHFRTTENSSNFKRAEPLPPRASSPAS
jgi:hypothetical protein